MTHSIFKRTNQTPIKLSELEALKEGKTYKIKDNTTRREYVLKVIDKEDEIPSDFFEEEFRKMKLLSDHPNVATSHFIHSCLLNDENYLCYSIDYISGKSLKSYLEDIKVMSLEQAYIFTESLIDAMERAHMLNICHYDLHDENIIIEDTGKLSIIDFTWFNRFDESAIKKDIIDLKSLLQEVGQKLCNTDKNYYSNLLDFIFNDLNLIGKTRLLTQYESIWFELKHLKINDIQILLILKDLASDFEEKDYAVNTNGYIFPNLKVPNCLIDQKFKKIGINLLEPTKRRGPPLFDANPASVPQTLTNYFNMYTITSKHLKLCNFQISEFKLIKNDNNLESEGYDYYYKFWFQPTIKFLKLMRNQAFIYFLERHTISEYTFHDCFHEYIESTEKNKPKSKTI